MQNIPVDTARLGTIMCVVPPEPRINTETGQIRTDRDGNTIYVVGVSVRQLANRRADVIEIAVPVKPVGLAEGMRVTVADLIAVAWEIDGRKGTSFRASGITSESATATVSGGAVKAKTAGGEN
ncbi:hypothetical protein [Streptomyces sp. SPB162]|uniref:SCO3933 family regulatory protein n=1 Tax=Streptomyces sp. SPB162 TaxID=2940560 RepID=UPI002405A9BE|nr:hypothetical protein [Streptomyces sp. SPB162]MDF9815211.1 hypothetical protein [Streptomyces sp. SPB162]